MLSSPTGRDCGGESRTEGLRVQGLEESLLPRFSHEPLLTDLSQLRGTVAIFGGSFDPIHSAHIEAAERAKHRLNLDAVVFVPAARNPLKGHGPHATDMERLELTRAAIVRYPDLYVTPLELLRGPPSFTVDTIREFLTSAPGIEKLSLIVGGDCLSQLAQWRDIEKLLGSVEFIIIERGDRAQEIAAIKAIETWYPRAKITYLPSPRLASSTEVRAEIKSGELSTATIPKATLEIIKQRRLYGFEPPTGSEPLTP